MAGVIGAARRVDEQGGPADAAYYGYDGRAEIGDGFHGAEAWMHLCAQPGVTPWNFGAVAVSREVLAESGGLLPEIGLCSDVEAVIPGGAYGEIGYVTEPLMDYTVRDGSDRSSRARRNREEDDPLSAMGLALLAGLRAHQERRTVTARERDWVYAAVARRQLQRAVQHRYLPGGRGPRGALLDVGRAFCYSPRTALEPEHLLRGLAAIPLPGRLLANTPTAGLTRRYASGNQPTNDLAAGRLADFSRLPIGSPSEVGRKRTREVQPEMPERAVIDVHPS